MRWIDITQFENRVVGRALAEQAERIPDDPFLLSGTERLTFGEINARADALATGLRGLGVGQGDTVALLLENSIDFAALTFAVNKLGAVWVPTNTTYRGEWLRQTFEDGDAKVLVVDAEFLPEVAELGPLPFKHVVVRGETAGTGPDATCTFDELARPGVRLPPVEVSPKDTSAVMWTSGTTGRSKGVMQSHSAWLWCAQLISRARDVGDGDVFYCCVPMYNSGGWVLNVHAGLVSGLPVAIDRHFSVGEFWNRCRYYGATQVLTLGAMHMYLWQAPPQPDDADNPVRSAGLIPMPAELVEPFKERFGIDYVWQGFGQSEVMPWTVTYPGRTYKPGSTGVPREDLEVVLLDDDDNPVPTGEVGEVCIRPRRPNVIFSGYWRQPEYTARAFANLWYHSGDLGGFDDDGELYFVDRKADFMRYKGRNISSFEVERVVSQHPGVAEVAAHGVPSEELATEDEVKICVVRRPEVAVSAEEVARFVNDHAPYFMVPRYVEFVDELPHTPTGRVQKFVLRERGVGEGSWDRERSGFEVRR